MFRLGGVRQAALRCGTTGQPVLDDRRLGAGRLGLASIVRCVSIALAIVVLYYGMEEWITAGRMSRSILVAAGSVGNVHPSDWFASPRIFFWCSSGNAWD